MKSPETIRIARESRGLTGKDLADLVGFSQSKLSKIESGVQPASDADLEAISSALAYPVRFFELPYPSEANATAAFHHRKRQSLRVGDRKKIHASILIRKREIEELLRDVEVSTAEALPRYDIEDYRGEVKQIARMVRAAWGIPDGPIANLTELLELNGCIVMASSFGTDRIDAVSMLLDSAPALVFANKDITTDRMRWTLAHELGHLVMHFAPSPEVEDEADLFAGEFLLPSEEVIHDLCPPLDMRKLVALKQKWGVSIQALIRRASRLKLIGERRYRSLMIDLTKRGWRRQEPVTLPPEVPSLLSRLLDFYRTELDYSLDDLASRIGLEPLELARIYFPGESKARFRLTR